MAIRSLYSFTWRFNGSYGQELGVSRPGRGYRPPLDAHGPVGSIAIGLHAEGFMMHSYIS